MPRSRYRPALFAPLLAAALLPRAAAAQSEPKFTFGKVEETKPSPSPAPAVEWKAQVKGGFVITGGNSQTENGTLAASVSRKAGSNRLSVDVAAAYGRSNLFSPTNIDTTTSPPMITSLDRHTVVTTNNWLLRGATTASSPRTTRPMHRGRRPPTRSRARRSSAADRSATAASC